MYMLIMDEPWTGGGRGIINNILISTNYKFIFLLSFSIAL